MAGDATGKRQHHTAKYVVRAGGELVGRAGHVRVGDGMRVITVEFLAIGKQRYYGLMGSSVARFRGADAYRPLEAAVEAAKEKAFATGDRKDKAEVSRLMRDLRRRGWRPQPVTDTIEALKGLSMARAVADGAGATLRVAAQRLHLLLDGNGAYWTWTRSATTRRLAFQREMAAYRGIEHMLQYLAPRDNGQETLLTIGHFPGRRSFSNEGMASPVRRLRRHASRLRSLVITEESWSSRRCATCVDHTKQVEYKYGMQQQVESARRAHLASLIQGFNAREGRADGSFVPHHIYRAFKEQSRFRHRWIRSTSVCHSCTGSDGLPATERAHSRDYSSARNIARCFYHVLANSGQRPLDLRARRDLSGAGAQAESA